MTRRVDVYPQWLNLTRAAEATAGTFVETETQMPVQLQHREVIEVLAVQWRLNGGGVGASGLAADLNAALQGQITKVTKASMANLPDSTVVDSIQIQAQFAYAEATETGAVQQTEHRVVLHNFANAGHGFLVASQSLFCAAQGSATLAKVQVGARILYRIVTVSAEELLGLVRE